jgi:CHAT domain-containing protein
MADQPSKSHCSWPLCLASDADAQSSFTEQNYEIDADISQSRLFLSELPRFHPLRPISAGRLAFRLLQRYLLLNQRDDLDKAILYSTESLLFFPVSWLAHGAAIFEVYFNLASSLLMRSRVSKEPEDAVSTAKYLRHLRDPACALSTFLRQLVTALLMETLEFQMELKAIDIVQGFEEMAALTHELITSDPSSVNTTRAIQAIARALLPVDVNPFPHQLLNQIIECLHLARTHKPKMLGVPFVLAKCLISRYPYTMNDELDEVASIADELIASGPPGAKFVALCQKLLPNLAMLRLSADLNLEYSEEAIYRARTFLSSSSAEDVLHPSWSYVLERAAKNRFKNFGPMDGFEASPSDLLPSRPLQAEVAVEKHPLSELLDGIRNNDIIDIDEAIELGRSKLASSDPNDLQAPRVFGKILVEAFNRSQKIEHLNESINTHRQLLARSPPKFERFSMTHLLVQSLNVRAEMSRGHCAQDVYEVVGLYPQLFKDGNGWLSSLHQLHAACRWAFLARATEHPSVSTAYETAVSLMQDTMFCSPTLALQHATLATAPDVISSIPLDYASYQVDLGQLEEVIETLERGRALLWSEMRRLRTSSDQLSGADPELGDKFAAVNRELEELTKSIAPSHEINKDDAVVDDLRAGDKFGRLLRRQRGLLKERDKLISQIRALPGFDRFLTFPLFDTLRSAASSGPVIIINHSKPRSDILILLHNASPSLILTPDDFYRRASALKDKLLSARVKDGLDSSQYNEALASVLTELYELVGKPVIERLRQLQVPEKSRVWWCPTSVFCSLPLHAMGPISSDDGEMQYFLDLYICSYTPSLSALIQSRTGDSGSRSSRRPSILLVAQPDPSLPTVSGELQVIQALDTEVTSLISEAATPPTVIDGFRDHQFVHFACHGTLEPGKPFEAGFELHGDERLTLLEIVRSDLPTAEFAFLSACHTAEVTEGSIMDEGLHLAAAVQYCGFRSVVGTMWAMMDEDGQDLAENFYKALFSNSRKDRGTPYHERSAKALRFAVKKLRKKRHITLERWVNFVHYGA